MPIRGDSFEMLPEAIEAARTYVMSYEEREEQRRNFAHGNVALHNPAVTREVIDRAADSLELQSLREMKEQVDDVLVIDWITAKDNNYRQALADLVGWNIKIHDDPCVSEIAARRLKIEKLVEAADYLQHCRRREIQATAMGRSDSAKRSVERASEQYDFLRGQVKL